MRKLLSNIHVIKLLLLIIIILYILNNLANIYLLHSFFLIIPKYFIVI